jgi:hypothetical protein
MGFLGNVKRGMVGKVGRLGGGLFDRKMGMRGKGMGMGWIRLSWYRLWILRCGERNESGKIVSTNT